MTRFNVKSVGTKTVNLAGGKAYKESSKLEFISILLTSFVQNQYYKSADDTIDTIRNLINSIADKKFIAKSAIYARTKFGMRSISHVVAGEIAKLIKGEQWTKSFFDKVVYRPDDITEILSYYFNTYGKPVPNSLKKGLALSFNKFNEYQLAKYRGENNAISLVDAVNLVHPIPFVDNAIALKKLVEGTLKSKDTWEKELTQAGQKAESEEDKKQLKKEVWIKLIKEKKIGYFALLRNLRNILEQAPEIIYEAILLLTNETLIKKSLVLPFRYLTAIKQMEQLKFEGVRDVIVGLNQAVDKSLSNVPKFDGKTLVILDTSGSMEGRPAEIGSLFSAILIKTNNADFINFSEKAHYQNLNPLDSTLTITNNIHFQFGGTNFHSIFQTANKPYKRIIILSDMQGWMEDNYGYGSSGAPTKAFVEYKNRCNCDPIIYSFDLQGYGTLQFPERNVYCIAGFSEKIFDVIKLLEQDKQALIHEIEKIELST